MCDICWLKCKVCKRGMSIHIADFCTARKNVIVFCPDHVDNGLKYLAKVCLDGKVFASFDHAQEDGEYCEIDGGKKGDTVFIVCTDPNAYGIHLN